MHSKAYLGAVACLMTCLSTVGVPLLGQGVTPQGSRNRALSFAGKMRIRVPEFQATGRPMAELAVSLAYKYKLPMAIEHVSRDSLRKPLTVKLKGQTVRQVLASVVGSVPGYRVDFSEGLVDIYSPSARNDPSNPFNTVISHYIVDGLDTHFADAQLLCDIARQLHGHSGCGGSIASGQWGNRKITLDLRNKRVYEILNAIVAQNGAALWTPIPEREGGSPSISGNFWYIYPLDRAFESSAIERLQALVPPGNRGRK